MLYVDYLMPLFSLRIIYLRITFETLLCFYLQSELLSTIVRVLGQ